MRNNNSKGILWLGLISSIIFLLLNNIFSWVKDKDYNYLLTVVDYKWQLNLFVLIILALIFYIIYQRIFNSKKTKLENTTLSNIKLQDNENERTEMMNNLSQEEKEILSEYVKSNTKSQQFYDSAITQNLVKNGILFEPYNTHALGAKRAFNLEEWVWEFLIKNRHKFE